jgi:hypothetical protein
MRSGRIGGRRVTADPRTIPPLVSTDQDQPAALHEHPASARQATAGQQAPVRHVWLLRTRALLFVTVCATFGVLLLILPWTPKWTDNPLLLTYPGLRNFVSSGFVRGLSSGLGVLDLWLGFWEAIHYHETPS